MDFLVGLKTPQSSPGPETGSAANKTQDENAAAEAPSGSHCQRVYDLLLQTVRPEWHKIPEPTSDAWLAKFILRVSKKKPLSQEAAAEDAAGPQGSAEGDEAGGYGFKAFSPREGDEANGYGFKTFSFREEFLLLSKVTSRIDTPWVQALRRLRAVEECEASRPLGMAEVVNYAKRLAGSVAAPPETANVVDVVAHQSAFPTYHFLPYPSMEELQNSRLAALAAKPYAEICFPPEVTAKLVYLRRAAAFGCTDTPNGRVPAYDTSLLSECIWESAEDRAVFYQLQFTCPTPCCIFWLAVVSGLLPASQPLPSASPMRQLASVTPVLVPGPFPKTIRMQCRKQGKKPSRITQTFLRLKGTAAAAAAAAGPPASQGQQQKRDGGDRQASEGHTNLHEAGGDTQTAAAAAPPAGGEEARVSAASQFHGLMLGASRRRGQHRPQEISSESSSGSSSDGD